MNVKTIKRISKRSVSMLLSVLMVLSLFTVCLVGTTVTAGAWTANNTEVKVKKPTGWTQIFVYVGNTSATSWVKMSQGSDGFYKANITWANYSGFFFADTDMGSNGAAGYSSNYDTVNGNKSQIFTEDIYGTKSINLSFNTTGTITVSSIPENWSNVYLYVGKNGHVQKYTVNGTDGYKFSVDYNGYSAFFFSSENNLSGSDINSLYNSVDDTKKSGILYTEQLSTSDSYIVTAKNGEQKNVSATLWNYRTEDQHFTNANSRTNDRQNGMHGCVSDMKTYGRYNTAVADWFRTNRSSGDNTPLYQGNIRNGTATDDNGTLGYIISNGTFNSLFDYFVSVANGANRKDGANGASTRSVARYLVDTQLNSNGNITQNGVELPQFSEAFAERYNNKNVSVQKSPKYDWSGMNTDNFSYGFGSIQSQYKNLSMEFETTKTYVGNTRYSYNAKTDGNRTLNSEKTKLGKDSEVYGGYYPFNDNANIDDIIDCFGTRLDIEFNMPSEHSGSGYQMRGTRGYEDLIFNFSGDDDVWVYVDGYLALDLGGSHNNAVGTLNLSKMTYQIKTGWYDATWTSNSSTHYSASKNYNTMSSPASLNTIRGYNSSDNLGNQLIDSLKDTSKTHTITVFYLERGQFDSNFAMDFMLPVVADTSLTVEQKVDSTSVNAGLIAETLNVANKDIFSVNVKSNSTTNNSRSNSTAVLSNGINFNRGDVIGNGSTKIQDGSKVTTSTTVQGFSGANNISELENVDAYFKWTDSATNDNTSTGEALATGDGVGVPSDGNVFLQYGQKAMFTDQFDVNTKLYLVPGDKLYKYKDSTIADNYSSNGLLKTEENTGRKLTDYYEPAVYNSDRTKSTFVVTDANNQVLNPAANVYNYDNTGTSNHKKAQVTAVATNKIKTSSFTVEKLLADGNDSHEDDEFLFEIKASKIFGEEYKDNSNNTVLKSVQPEFKIQEDGKDDINGSYQLYKYDNDTKKYEIVPACTVDAINAIKLKAGQKAVFDGIPVDSVFEVKEISSDNNLRVTIEDKTQDAVDAENVIRSKVETKSDDDKTAVVTVGTDVKSASAQVTNNFASTKIPVLYRYIDRNITSGQITVLEKHYTYYLKWIDGSDNAITSDNKVNADYITQKIIPSSLNVDNLLYKYKLSTQQNSYKVVDLPTYTTDFDVDDPLRNDPIGHAPEASEATAEGLQSCFDDIKANKYSGKIILAEYDKVQAKYSVRVYYPDSEEGSFVEKKVGPFTDKISYTAITPSKNPKADDELARKFIYKVNGTDTECTFAYWERLITVRTGSKAESIWTPVTSNYTYSLAINDTTELRPVYYYTKDGKDYRVTYGENGTKPFTRLDTVYGEYPQFKTIDQNKYQYFHVTTKVVREYDANDNLIREETTPIENCWQVPITNDYNIKTQPANTYREFTSEEKALKFVKELAESKQYPTNFVEEHEPYDEFMNSYYNKNVGTDATVTDRTYDMYTKTTSNTDGTAKVESYTRINMIFGAAGSPDTDREITNIGYVLVKGSTGYESKTADQLKNLVGDGFTNSTNLTTGTMTKSYTVNDWLASSSDDYNNKPGAVNLTNKNRCQIVFDLKTSSQSYYTCYTFMVMQEKNADGTATGKKQIYISNTPANFRTSEAQQSIDTTEIPVKKQFYVNLTSVASDENGNEISGKTALGKVETDQPIAVNGKKFTIKATPLTSGNKKGKLVRIDIGHMSITGDVELTDFQSGIGYSQPQLSLSNYINDEESSHTTTFDIKAYYAEVDNGVLASLPNNDNYNNYLSVVEIKDNNGNIYTPGQIIPYNGVQYVDVKVRVKSGVPRLISNVTGDGSGFNVVDGSMIATKHINITEQFSDEDFVEEMAKVSTSPAVIYRAPTPADRQSQHVKSITVSAIVGGAPIVYPGGDSSGNYSLIPDGTEITVTLEMEKGYKPSADSIYQGSTSHTMTVTSENYVGENALKEALKPYSEEITYNVTIQVKSDQTSMGSASGTYNGGDGTTSIVVRVKDSDEINLTATPYSGYKFDKWDISGNATIANQTSATTKATITGDTTITASFASLAKKIYFALVRTNYSSEKYPRLTGGTTPGWDGNSYPEYVWKSVNAHVWKDGGSNKTSWPGTAMNYEGVYNCSDFGDAAVYSITLTDEEIAKYDRIIFNGGNGTAQSEAITISSSSIDKVFYSNGGIASGDFTCGSKSISSWTKKS